MPADRPSDYHCANGNHHFEHMAYGKSCVCGLWMFVNDSTLQSNVAVGRCMKCAKALDDHKDLIPCVWSNAGRVR